MEYALEARGITKAFPGVLANDHVDFNLRKGEIHALLGENGAGKSTLMNILYGLYSQDEGQILISGKEVSIKGPSDAINHGIGMVHQHFMLVPVMTVAENIVLGTEVVMGGFVLDQEEACRRIEELSKKYGLEVDPRAYVKDLPVGTQQRVEIIKALYREADILILDEPTAVLTPQEVEELFVIMKSLTAQGKSIVFITHKLKEVLAVADRISVMRLGRMVGTALPEESTQESLAALMVGREVILTVDKEPAKPKEVILQVTELKARDDRDTMVLNGASFEVHAGEVLGIAGVQGNGQTELVEVLAGLRKAEEGAVIIEGVDMTNHPPRDVTEMAVAHVPEDRHKYGMVASYPVADNMVLNTYYMEPFAHGMVIDDKEVEEYARKLVHEFDVRTPSVYTSGGALSGGNQQKMVVARELGREVKLLVASQPTRGVDVGSIEFIHNRIVEARDKGVAVLLVSAELDEIFSLADRIAVMYHGKIVATIPREDAVREEIGLLMAGISQEEALSGNSRKNSRKEEANAG